MLRILILLIGLTTAKAKPSPYQPRPVQTCYIVVDSQGTVSERCAARQETQPKSLPRKGR